MTPEEQLTVLWVAPIIGAIFAFIALKKGFFNFTPSYQPEKAPKLLHVFLAFLIFFGIQVMIAFSTIHFWRGEAIKSNPIYAQTAIQGLALLASAIPLIIFSFYKKVRSLWGTPKKSAFTLGLISWFIIIPWVVFLSEGGSYLVENYFGTPTIDQDPVRYLKELFRYPELFWLSALAIITLVPISEEILFRGFLQTYLIRYLPVSLAIGITAIIFAAFHFSTAQGLSNIGLLPPLFLLACFLGFLRAKSGSLLTSITLHSLFNAINIIMLYFS